MTAVVRSTNLAVPKPDPGSRGRRPTGIDKRPVAALEVFTPGPSYGDGPGVAGDLVGDDKHHGGAQKAVYAFAREELDYWEQRLGRSFTDGSFGENLTTEGVVLEDLLVNQPVTIGDAVLEVSVVRSPCATFAGHIGEPGWVKTFTGHGRCGTYLRVVRPGTVSAGDTLEFGPAPAHPVTIATAFAAAMGDDDAAAAVVSARCLPAMYHDRLVRRLARA
ncbi:MOSC domain-containing protein [Gordonia sp. VNK21]|uniref:MOSC domain-containing protein n=1 Tax=Gordonia sp. VNK21 TaxID=3382483 RepID=UPI0038D3BD7F